MYKGRNVAVVIPAYNEEPFIANFLRSLPAFVDRIVVIDDCSQDHTVDAATSVSDDRLLVLYTPQRWGMGGAMLLGYQKALDLGSDIIVKMDGDGQMDPKWLPRLLDGLLDNGAQYVKGNRFLATASLALMPRHRLVGNFALTFMTKLASGYWHIFDAHNGYTAITAETLQLLDLNALDKGYFFQSDILIQLNYHDLRVMDVSIPARYGLEKSSQSPLKAGVVFPLLFLGRFFHRVYQKYVLRDFSPIALFLFSGLALFLWGIAFGIYLTIKSTMTGHPTPTGTIMLSVLPVILGFQLLLQAIVLDIQQTPK